MPMTSLLLIQIALGAALLLVGKRLSWLLAAGAGYALGVRLLAGPLAGVASSTAALAPWVLAVLFALVMLLGKQALLNLIGFVAGGVVLGWLLSTYGVLPAQPGMVLVVAVFVAGGLLGAALLNQVFDLGMVVLSALLGALLVLGAAGRLMPLPATSSRLILLLLVAVGAIVQLRPRK